MNPSQAFLTSDSFYQSLTSLSSNPAPASVFLWPPYAVFICQPPLLLPSRTPSTPNLKNVYPDTLSSKARIHNKCMFRPTWLWLTQVTTSYSKNVFEVSVKKLIQRCYKSYLFISRIEYIIQTHQGVSVGGCLHQIGHQPYLQGKYLITLIKVEGSSHCRWHPSFSRQGILDWKCG